MYFMEMSYNVMQSIYIRSKGVINSVNKVCGTHTCENASICEKVARCDKISHLTRISCHGNMLCIQSLHLIYVVVGRPRSKKGYFLFWRACSVQSCYPC